MRGGGRANRGLQDTRVSGLTRADVAFQGVASGAGPLPLYNAGQQYYQTTGPFDEVLRHCRDRDN
jgi:hypothetical protein